MISPKGFIEFIADSIGVEIPHIVKTVKPKKGATSGSTLAHWQIAMVEDLAWVTPR
jgi:hypothetical protein